MAEPTREVTQEYRCHCVLVDGIDEEHACLDITSGPDDPFCKNCEKRHVDMPAVQIGVTVVTARFRREEMK